MLYLVRELNLDFLVVVNLEHKVSIYILKLA